ncbi:MAG: hypothetical protein RLN82_09600 [Pseudomonadales bacterium]
MKRRIALFLIRLLSRFTYTERTVAKEQHKVEPVIDKDGNPLVLHYLGKDRQMYKFKNEADMAVARAIWSKFFDTEKELRIQRDELSKSLHKTIDSVNKGEVSQAGFNLIMLKDWVDNLTPMEVLLNQAGIMFFDEEEDLRRFDGDRHHVKLQAMKAHPDQGFFLNLLLSQSGISGDQSLKDIQSYLFKSQVKIKSYRRIISGHEESSHGKNGKT